MNGGTSEMSWTLEGVRERYRELEERASAAGDSAMSVLASEPLCRLDGTAEGGSWSLTVYLTGSLLRAVRKNLKGNRLLVWKTLLNLRYGYLPEVARSPGGKDGIFDVTRDFRPRNEMVRELYDRYPHSQAGVREMRAVLKDVENLRGVRVVSHGLRLLGYVEADDDGQDRSFRLLLVGLDVNRR